LGETRKGGGILNITGKFYLINTGPTGEEGAVRMLGYAPGNSFFWSNQNSVLSDAEEPGNVTELITESGKGKGNKTPDA